MSAQTQTSLVEDFLATVVSRSGTVSVGRGALVPPGTFPLTF